MNMIYQIIMKCFHFMLSYACIEMYPFNPCSTIGIFGCTSSGKTSLVFRLLKERASMVLSDPPEKILYCYNISQPLFLEMEKELEYRILSWFAD